MESPDSLNPSNPLPLNDGLADALGNLDPLNYCQGTGISTNNGMAVPVENHVDFSTINVAHSWTPEIGQVFTSFPLAESNFSTGFTDELEGRASDPNRDPLTGSDCDRPLAGFVPGDPLLNGGSENSNEQNLSNNALSASITSIESALSFDGNDYIQVGSSSSLVMTNSLSIEAWIHPLDGGVSGVIVGKEGEYLLSRFSDGTIRWAVANANPGWTWNNTGYIVPTNQWTHLAVTYDNGVIKTYANGILANTYNGSGLIGDADTERNNFTIGARQWPNISEHFTGTIDEVRIWNVPRTQADIQADMSNRLLGSEPGLVGYWNFDEGSGNAVLDKTSNGNNGLLGAGSSERQPVWTTSAAPSNPPEVIPSQYRNLVLADAPMGYWSLDEINWPVAVDSSGNSSSGSYLNGVALGASGSVGTSASFDGINDAVEIPINSPETNYTYELWFKTSVATGGISSVRQGVNSSDDRDLYLKDGNIYNYLWSGEKIGSSGKNYADDKWHHVAVVVQSGVGQKLYVDSELVASGAKGESNFNWDTYLVLGKAYEAYGQGFNFPAFKGSIDEVALYNSILSADQIRTHYIAKSVQQGAFPDLVVTDATVPTTVAWGETIPVSWKVTNQSGAATSASWSDRVYLSYNTTLDSSDTLLGTFSTATQIPLAIANSYILNKNVVIPNNIDPNQTWYLLFATDTNVEQVETDKSNNLQSVALNLSMPDLVYFNNFESAVGSEWSTTNVDNTYPKNFSRFLGRFSNEFTTLALSTVPGQVYRLEFDFYAIDSWDGNYPYYYGPDYLDVSIDSERLFHETFHLAATDQSYRKPDQEPTDLGFGGWTDSIYRRIPLVFTATNSTTQIKFADGGLQGLNDESWGIDNVKVWTVDATAAPPDLAVTSITPPASAAMNETIPISWTVKNQGTGTALNNWLDRVYLSKNTLLDSTAISLGTASVASLTPPGCRWNLYPDSKLCSAK